MSSWILAKSPAIVTAGASLGLLIAQAADGVQIGTNSVVTIGLLVVIVGAAVYLTSENTTLKNAAASSIDRANGQDKRIDAMGEKLDKVYEDFIIRTRGHHHEDV